jgi:hypothetical protein
MKVFNSLLILAMFCCACSRGKYYISDIFSSGKSTDMETMALDSTYHFYLREVYRVKNLQNEYILKTNIDKNDSSVKTRIEVEYLLLSRVHKNAIYISTIPDKYQHYYSANFYADTLINAYDFSTFHFGKISEDGESISFISKDGKKVVTWDIRPFIIDLFPKKLSIREIAVQRKEMVENVILINKSLEEPLSFSLQKNFAIIFEKPGRKQDTCKDGSLLCRLSDQKIYFYRGDRGQDVIFRFNKNIGKPGDSVIRFDYRRTRYTPVREQL